ncbi:MAG: TIM barrel protein [Candidatus Saliniplasma sp.]
MIRFGPSGIPLSCKGRTLLDGVLDVHKLGLSALEVQFLRMNPRTRPADEDEIGLKANEVEGKFIIGVNRGKNYQKIYTEDMDKELEPGDMIHFLSGGVAEEYYRFPLVGKIAKEVDVNLTIHTPYYMKLTETSGDLVEKSKRGFKYTSVMGNSLDADMVITHLGIKNENMTDGEILDASIENIRELRNWINVELSDDLKIGLEVQAGKDVYGSLENILDVCRKVSDTVPVLNFAHLQAMEAHDFVEPEDFEEIFDRCKNFATSNYYVHFSGVEVRSEDEYRFTPIKRGDLNFEVLVDHLLDFSDNVTIISGSPLKEHDAMYMKVIYERLYSKEIAKELRRKQKGE